MKKIKILLVCTANICRSPMAEGILSRLLESEGKSKFCRVDSAGTHVAHVRRKPDQRAHEIAARHGVDLSRIRARKVHKGDFSAYDYIVAMDEHNLHTLRENCPEEHMGSLFSLVDFAPELGLDEVPDPYYGNMAGFERVYEILDHGLRGLLGQIRRDLAEKGLNH